MNEKPLSTRDRILQAGAALVLDEGINRLTLEAAADRAGVSKGGLLYHFPNKAALVQGMLDYLLADFQGEIERHLPPAGATPRHRLRAYVLASLLEDETERLLSAGLLAAVALDPALLDGWRDAYQAWQTEFETGSRDPVLATIVRLAADGLWLLEMFDMGAPRGELRAAVQQRLLSLAAGATGEEDGP